MYGDFFYLGKVGRRAAMQVACSACAVKLLKSKDWITEKNYGIGLDRIG